ncbi:ATP-binding cassette domain-containing protein [Mycoplasma sp. AC1221]
MIRFKNVDLKYTDKIILKNVNLDITTNCIVGLIGKSGTGKSTILKSFFDFELITSGYYLYNGAKILKNKLKKYKNDIIYIAPDDNLITSLDFYKNLQHFYKKYKNPLFKWLRIFTKQQKEEIFQLCNHFGMSEFIFKPIEQLSAGQKQRFAIILNLLNDTKILLCDELTSNLDITNAKLVFDYLQSIKKNKYIIIALHNLSDAVKYIDKIIAIKDQEIQKIYYKGEYDPDELRKYFD